MEQGGEGLGPAVAMTTEMHCDLVPLAGASDGQGRWTADAGRPGLRSCVSSSPLPYPFFPGVPSFPTSSEVFCGTHLGHKTSLPILS